MEQKQDLRITKTYLALTRAFFDMMEETPFEEIRVKELCDRAMVRKSTFYKHFADKYEFLAYVVREKHRSFDTDFACAGGEREPVDYYTQIVSYALRFLKENERIVQVTAKSNSFALILTILAEEITPSIRHRLQEDKQKGRKMPATPEVMAPFFVGAVMESVKNWINGGRKLQEEALAEQLANLITTVYRAENN